MVLQVEVRANQDILRCGHDGLCSMTNSGQFDGIEVKVGHRRVFNQVTISGGEKVLRRVISLRVKKAMTSEQIIFTSLNRHQPNTVKEILGIVTLA